MELTGRIVFSAGEPHAEDIFVVNADGTGVAQLTHDPAAEFDPAWSPDGAMIAYRHQDGDDGSTEIYVMNADGSAAHAVTNNDVADWGPAWTRDGLVAWNSAQDVPIGFHLWVANPDGSGAHAVGDALIEYAAPSPDGEWVAYMAQEPDAHGSNPDYNIWVMASDGSDSIRLTDAPGEDGWPAWSPDGSQIAFTSTRDDQGGGLGPFHQLYLMNADGSDQHRLTEAFAQFADWSPDGQYIVFAPGLNVIRPDGTVIGSIPLEGVPGDPLFPDWTADAG